MAARAIYNSFVRQMDSLNAVRADICKLDVERDRLARAFLRTVRHIMNGALGRKLDDYSGPTWDQFLSNDYLRTPGSRYIVLNLLAGESIIGRRRIDIKWIVVDENSLCVDERDGRLLSTNSDQYMFKSCFDLIIPLSCPALDNHHTPRAVKAAWDAFAAKNYGEILRIEDALDDLILKSGAIEAGITLLGETGVDTAGRETLIGHLRSMDWSYDYADRPSRLMAEQEREIRVLLNDTPIEMATVLLVRHVGGYFQYIRSYLATHPELMAQAA